jgi:large subunit ribosomal protein L10
MAISKAKKQTIVQKTNEVIKSPMLFFVDFSRAKTQMVDEFKKAIKDLGAIYTIVKKNLLKVSLKAENRDIAWLDSFPGTVGMVYASSTDKQVELAKAIQKFVKDNNSKVKTKDSLTVISAYFGAELWPKDQVVRLAQIPSKEVLQGQLVNIISYPIAGFAQVLAGAVQNFLLTLKEIEKTKSQTA